MRSVGGVDQQPVSSVSFGVLGPVVAWDGAGERIDLKGPRHREVLALLIAARGRVVPVATLVDELWTSPPPGAVGALRTFVGALRQALEPDRPARAPAKLLVTEGPGYALRAEEVDAWRFERALEAATVVLSATPAAAWSPMAIGAAGRSAAPAAAGTPVARDAARTPSQWARLGGPRRRARRGHRLRGTRRERHRQWARLGGPRRPARQRRRRWAIPPRRRSSPCARRWGCGADRRTRTSPTRCGHAPSAPGWPSCGSRPSSVSRRRGSRSAARRRRCRTSKRTSPSTRGARTPGACSRSPSIAPAARPTRSRSLRRARALLVEQLALDPGPALQRLETDILNHADHLAPPQPVDELWARAAADYDRTVAVGARARLESTVALLRDLAVTGGLEAARAHRAAAVAAAEELGDPELTARVIGAYDVPAIWTRVDDPDQSARIVAAAERTLVALGPDAHAAARARLLATIALESRGTRDARAREAAREAERTARRLDDPTLLAFALNAVFMQRFERAGLAPERDAIGAELVDLSARHGLANFEVLGHLIRLQASCALADHGRRGPPRGGGRRAGGAARATPRPRLHRLLRRTQGRHRGGLHRGRRTARRRGHARPGGRAPRPRAALCSPPGGREAARRRLRPARTVGTTARAREPGLEAGGPRGAAQSRSAAARPAVRAAVVPDRPRGALPSPTTARSNAHARRSPPPRTRSRRGVASSHWAQWRSSSNGAGS